MSNFIKQGIRNIMLVTIILASILPKLYSVETEEWAVALNLSGKQRMLSQKMAKEFLLVKLGIENTRNEDKLAKTMKLFDTTLNQLISGDENLSIPKAPNKKILKQLTKTKKLWLDYKKSIKDKNIREVALNNVYVLTNMNKAVGLYEKAAVEDDLEGSGNVINVAGRQRMLSQKMSKEIFLIALDHNVDVNLGNLKDTRNLFNRSLKGLIKGSKRMNLPSTKNKIALKQIKKVAKIWVKFRALVDKVIKTKETDEDLLEQIYDQNPILLKEMNKAVKYYEEFAR